MDVNYPGYFSNDILPINDRPYETFSCTVCSKQFITRETSLRHENKHYRVRSHPRTPCPKSCVTSDDLLRHKLKSHIKVVPDTTSKYKRPYSCDVCNNEFSTSRLLQSHMISHSDYRPYSCSKCNLSFKTTTNRNRHEKICSTQRHSRFTISGEGKIIALYK